MGKSAAIGCAGAILLLILIGGVSIGGSYNSLVNLDQATQAQWAQVQNAYQRRADLVPNLVATVKGAANFEKSTMVEVTAKPKAEASALEDRKPSTRPSTTRHTTALTAGTKTWPRSSAEV